LTYCTPFYVENNLKNVCVPSDKAQLAKRMKPSRL